MFSYILYKSKTIKNNERLCRIKSQFLKGCYSPTAFSERKNVHVKCK